MSFLKRLFGTSVSANAPAPERTEADAITQCRAHVAGFDRRRQPKEWAEAMQLLGHNLMALANYAEADETVTKALEAAGPDAHPLFRASMLKILGETRYRHGEILTGDERGAMLADAANTLADALSLIQPHDNRTLWMEAATFRGAALHELGRLRAGPEGLAWMDDAAACFADIAAHGADGAVHPIGLYNRYAVLEQRGHRTVGGSRAMYYREARDALAQAMATGTFASRPDLTVKLAELDALIDAAD